MRIRRFAAFTRLFVLVASVVLLTSRVMLLLHEFAGHGAAAMLFGGRITGWYLFLFAGGRVSYETDDLDVARRLVIGLGGIAIELAIGTLAFLVARQQRVRARPVVAFCLLCVGTAVAGHGALYLARGVHYGFGDGALLARVLGGSRWIVVLAASSFAVSVAIYAGRRLAALPAAVFTGPPWRVAAAAFLVFLSASLVHGGLALAEISWFPDPRWAAIMEDASAAAARTELAHRLADAQRSGEPLPSNADRQRMLDALERARRPWPLDPVLATALVSALVVGLTRGARERRRASNVTADDPTILPSWRAIRLLAGTLVILLGVILMLRQLA